MTYSKKNRKHYRVCEVCLYSGICVKRPASPHSPQENRGGGGETGATSAPQSAPHKNNRDKDDLVHLQPTPPPESHNGRPGSRPGHPHKKNDLHNNKSSFGPVHRQRATPTSVRTQASDFRVCYMGGECTHREKKQEDISSQEQRQVRPERVTPQREGSEVREQHHEREAYVLLFVKIRLSAPILTPTYAYLSHYSLPSSLTDDQHQY